MCLIVDNGSVDIVREAGMAKRERIVYRGTVYWLQNSGRCFASRYPVHGERILHRRIWAERNGPIPGGCEVHHRDRDWRNSEISNLELLTEAEHYAVHSAERSAFSKQQEVDRGYLKLARDEAKKWHSSPEGVEWHRQHGIDAWKKRKLTGSTCRRWGAVF